jgi:hypothetical protein
LTAAAGIVVGHRPLSDGPEGLDRGKAARAATKIAQTRRTA